MSYPDGIITSFDRQTPDKQQTRPEAVCGLRPSETAAFRYVCSNRLGRCDPPLSDDLPSFFRPITASLQPFEDKACHACLPESACMNQGLKRTNFKRSDAQA